MYIPLSTNEDFNSDENDLSQVAIKSEKERCRESFIEKVSIYKYRGANLYLLSAAAILMKMLRKTSPGFEREGKRSRTHTHSHINFEIQGSGFFFLLDRLLVLRLLFLDNYRRSHFSRVNQKKGLAQKNTWSKIMTIWKKMAGKASTDEADWILLGAWPWASRHWPETAFIIMI